MTLSTTSRDQLDAAKDVLASLAVQNDQKADAPKRRVKKGVAAALSLELSHNYSLADLEQKHMPWGV